LNFPAPWRKKTPVRDWTLWIALLTALINLATAIFKVVSDLSKKIQI
jgi:hypothetical protein